MYRSINIDRQRDGDKNVCRGRIIGNYVNTDFKDNVRGAVLNLRKQRGAETKVYYARCTVHDLIINYTYDSSLDSQFQSRRCTISSYR